MYGNWNSFCNKRFNEFKYQVVEGFVGNTVFIKRSAIAKIGLWDEQIQAADFDLYVRTKKRSLEVGDIKPCHIALGTFIHHFIRITVHNKPTPFVDAQNLISLEWLKKLQSSGIQSMPSLCGLTQCLGECQLIKFQRSILVIG
jgi:GT2 family glycosyltransferase